MSEFTPVDPPETLHPTIPHPHPIATPGADRGPATMGTAGTPTAPPPTVCWADALGPNETFSSPIHTPAHSPSYSPLSSPRELPDADEAPPEPATRADVDLPSRDDHQGGSEGIARWWEGAGEHADALRGPYSRTNSRLHGPVSGGCPTPPHPPHHG